MNLNGMCFPLKNRKNVKSTIITLFKKKMFFNFLFFSKKTRMGLIRNIQLFKWKLLKMTNNNQRIIGTVHLRWRYATVCFCKANIKDFWYFSDIIILQLVKSSFSSNSRPLGVSLHHIHFHLLETEAWALAVV